MLRSKNKQSNQVLTMSLKNIILTLILAVVPAISFAAQTVTYYHLDAQGSTIAASDDQGNLLWREAYEPYGNRLRRESTDSNNIWYTGKSEDGGAGLAYFGARWYDPITGRFMGIDPEGYSELDQQSFNRFAYANNNPYKYIDPDGRNEVLIEIGVTSLIMYGVIATTNPEQAKKMSESLANAWSAFNENNSQAGDAGEGDTKSGTCPSCGGKTEEKISKISKATDKTKKEVKDKIHEVKKGIPKSTGVRNPDVEVCVNCGEVFPKAPNSTLGDSVGNIYDK